MGNIIDLLEEKNLFLEKFYRMNEEEIINFQDGNFDNLDNFYNSREKILGILGRIDTMVEGDAFIENESEVKPNDKKRAIQALDYKNELVTRILSQDLQILSFIENEKSEIIKELAQVKTTKKAIGSYKSGEEKKQLDEKA